MFITWVVFSLAATFSPTTKSWWLIPNVNTKLIKKLTIEYSFWARHDECQWIKGGLLIPKYNCYGYSNHSISKISVSATYWNTKTNKTKQLKTHHSYGKVQKLDLVLVWSFFILLYTYSDFITLQLVIWSPSDLTVLKSVSIDLR